MMLFGPFMTAYQNMAKIANILPILFLFYKEIKTFWM
jgi:hypothetical protein